MDHRIQSGSIPWLSESECVDRLRARPRVSGRVLTYSTLLEGWSDSELAALVGLDDHGFHRGDGVFEAAKLIHGRFYLLTEHLARLRLSASRLGIEIPFGDSDFRAILQKGLEHFPDSEGLLRIYVTRGPGGFTTNPMECLGPQIFLLLTPYKPFPEAKYQTGVSIGKSAVPIKPGWFAYTKSLNYLPNVMMKKEALERNLDFTITFDEESQASESSTENMIALTKDHVLCHPPLSIILKGCTMTRLFDLVESQGLLKVDRARRLSEQDLIESQELMMVGTTLDVLPVGRFEGHAKTVGPWAPRLRELIQEDQKKGQI